MQKTIRMLTPADLEVADSITMAAYQISYSRRNEIARYLALQPDGWRLATIDGQAAAMGGITSYELFSYVGLVGVLPSCQHYGLGTFLMQSLMQWAEERDVPTILLDATAGGQKLYQKLGFVEDDRCILFSLSMQTELIEAPYLATPTRLQEQDIAELVAFDAPYFGATRTSVFQRLLQEYPDRAFISRTASGKLVGYLFAQPQTLGPWVAETPEIAEQLLIRALSLHFEKDPQVLFSVTNDAAQKLLQRYGFQPKRELSHMRFGKPATFRQRAKIYGQASFGLG